MTQPSLLSFLRRLFTRRRSPADPSPAPRPGVQVDVLRVGPSFGLPAYGDVILTLRAARTHAVILDASSARLSARFFERLAAAWWTDAPTSPAQPAEPRRTRIAVLVRLASWARLRDSI